MGVSRPLLLTILITLSSFLSEAELASFEIVNICNYTVWPAVFSFDALNQPSMSTTGFTLKSGASFNLSVPNYWQGRVWGRTLCNESSIENFSCFTPDCGTEKVECDGNDVMPTEMTSTSRWWWSLRSRQQQLQLFWMLGRLERRLS